MWYLLQPVKNVFPGKPLGGFTRRFRAMVKSQVPSKKVENDRDDSQAINNRDGYCEEHMQLSSQFIFILIVCISVCVCAYWKGRFVEVGKCVI